MSIPALSRLEIEREMPAAPPKAECRPCPLELTVILYSGVRPSCQLLSIGIATGSLTPPLHAPSVAAPLPVGSVIKA